MICCTPNQKVCQISLSTHESTDLELDYFDSNHFKWNDFQARSGTSFAENISILKFLFFDGMTQL